MQSRRRHQYLIALLVGLAVLAAQLWIAYREFGSDLDIPKMQAMQQQLLGRLSGSAHALMVVAIYIVVAVACQLGMMLLAVAAYRSAAAALKPDWRDSVARCTLFVLTTFLVATFANRMLYPHSRAFAFVDLLMIQAVSPLLVWGSAVIVGLVCLVALARCFRSKRRLLVLAAIGMVWLGVAAGYGGQHARSTQQPPDVIVLGVDSLRPDHLRTYGFAGPELAPHIDAELSRSVVFDNAITPLARTFVAYSAVLTGKNPIHNGIRFNLFPRGEFSPKQMLPWTLRESGYYSVLAMDESRFANFDGSFGFDAVVTPSVGVLDFLLGGAYDTVATNLVFAFPPLSGLMNDAYANRAAFRTYRADDHARRVVAAIQDAPSEKPLFLVSHLCLPHWPYEPANLLVADDFSEVGKVPGFEDSSDAYLRALQVADGQFADILAALQKNGRLRNAVVVVMSDHGEGFGMRKDRLAAPAGTVVQTVDYGHGSFALSQAQHRVVLGMQRYIEGKPQWHARSVDGPASLIDIAPTVMQVLRGQSTPSPYEGRSLLPALDGHETRLPDRMRFIESGIRSTGVERADIDEKAVAKEMAYLYQITPDLRFEIKKQYLLPNLMEKQRGVVWQGRGVSTYPIERPDGGFDGCWLSADYASHTMSCIGFPAVDPKDAAMQEAVCHYYAGDAGFEARWCQPHAVAVAGSKNRGS